jgi:hypothetical protein
MFFKHLNSIGLIKLQIIKIERTSTMDLVNNKHRSELIISKHQQQQQQETASIHKTKMVFFW